MTTKWSTGLCSLCWALNMLLYSPISGQLSELKFSYLDKDPFLSNSIIHAALEDQSGYLWFGTDKGLVRWDGNHSFRFLPDSEDTTSISGKTIKDLKEDAAGNIWIATVGAGLNKYNPQTGIFTRFKCSGISPSTISGDLVLSLYIDPEGIFWVGTMTAGFNRFDPETGIFQRFNLNEGMKSGEDAFQRNSVFGFQQDLEDPNLLWIAGNDGLYLFDKSSTTIQAFPSTAPNSSGTSIQAICAVEAGSVWLATFGMGLVRFDTRHKTWHYLNEEVITGNTGTQHIFTSIIPKSKNELWFASPDQGGGILDLRTEQLHFFDPYAPQKNNILTGTTNQVYHSPRGTIWFMHQGKGISFAKPRSNSFDFFPVDGENCNKKFSFPEIADFAFDPQRQYTYVASSSCAGIQILDTQDKSLQKISPLDQNGNLQSFRTLLVDTKGILWIGAKNMESNRAALLQYHPSKEQLIPFEHPELSSIDWQNTVVTSILQDQEDQIWVAIDPIGLLKIKGEHLSIYPGIWKKGSEKRPISIRQLQIGPKGKLWAVSRNKGIFRFNGQFFEQYLPREIDVYNFTCMQFDTADNLWLGHGEGLLRVQNIEEKEERTLTFSKEHHFPECGIDRLYLDQKGNIWATAVQGLLKYHAASNSFIVLDERDGLTEKTFFRHGIQQHPDGRLFIGQNSGFYTFQPKVFFKESDVSNLVLSDLKVSGKSLIAQGTINQTKEWKLAYAQNFFTIYYSLIQHENAESINYQYKLDGFDEDWIAAGNQTFANYTRVPEGTYNFKIKATDRKLRTTTKSMNIHIAPPWYRTRLAYLIYILILVAALLLLNHYQKSRWHIRARLQLKEQEAKRLKELDQVKTRIFNNITHEFRTPLTVISGIVNESSDLQQIRSIVSRNSAHLIELINQLLALSKVESGQMKLDLVQEDIIAYLRYLNDSFTPLALSQKISLSFYSELSELYMDYDPEKLRQIISNLLANALKFTPEYGKIFVHVKVQDTILKIKIEDTGIGIAQEKIPLLFNRFYQVDNSDTKEFPGTGIGLALVKELMELMEGQIRVESEVGKGSRFLLEIPISQTAAFSNSATEEMKSFSSIVIPSPSATSMESTSENINPSDDLPQLLLIEDSADILRYIRQFLQQDYRIEVAPDGQAGIEKAKQLLPDIIISDVMMPKTNGYEVCKALKNQALTSHIPIILLTAKTGMEEKLKGLEAGADAFLSKPFRKEELLLRIKNLVLIRQKFIHQYQDLDTIEQAVETSALNEIDKVFLTQLEKTVRENLSNEDFKVNPHLCRAMMMSRPQLYRKVRALLNSSLSDYIKNMRMKAARKLLIDSSQSILDVAEAVGFKDQYYFIRVYQSTFKETPDDTRNRKIIRQLP